jgi:hypothetical protein
MHQFCSRDQDQEADTCTSGDRGFNVFNLTGQNGQPWGS